MNQITDFGKMKLSALIATAFVALGGPAVAHHDVPSPQNHERHVAAFNKLHDKCSERGNNCYAGRDVAEYGRARDGKVKHAVTIKHLKRMWRELHPAAEREHARRERAKTAIAPTWWPRAAASVVRCESRGNPRAYSSAGPGYYGLFQFDLRTWRSVGGRGLPTSASEAEQYYRAYLLWQRRGWAPWPVCGR